MYGLIHRGQQIAAYSNRTAARLARTSIFAHLKGVKIVKIGGGKKSNPTKAQKRARASRAAKQRGIIEAVKGLLKKTNPSAKITGARVVKLRDGVLKITPIRANKGRR